MVLLRMKIQFTKWIHTFVKKILPVLILISIILITPLETQSLSSNPGEMLFIKHCAGCHVNGGNIIRRNKTLKLKALKRNGLDNPSSIARVAREGIGIMRGYEDILDVGEDQLLANWIWTQAQKAWVQG